ncbi:MAG: 50S ribosomal protein L29 [Deltaproteobacteria bacterium]|nr:50S ribosomal protein L29 [Deltaproteobacteria bacterium]
MKASEIRDLSPEEMDAREQDLAEELLKLRFQKETGQISSPVHIREVRREIARIKTIRNEVRKG